MTDYKIEFHPGALKEAESAIQWYVERSSPASSAFIAELTHAVDKISHAPNRWPKYKDETRRYFFPRFPFSLIYRVKNDVIQIIAVMHHRRKPGYWSNRK